ncbi:MAG: carbamoyltransferase HypF [Vicinamibacteria bacterium]|nr:carbamoyltransferase HypF [Vicinamibacteria bacterium]
MGNTRLRVYVRGAVQGVGFRPTVYRIATELGLSGWVINSPAGVEVDLEGAEGAIARFVPTLLEEKPPRAIIQGLETRSLDPLGQNGFEVRDTRTSGPATTLVQPDIAVCGDCQREMLDPADRRFGYPFINCTNCGPRFTIIESLPYDRERTTMARFPMCPVCRAEYEDPRDRRFHAQPNACPECGPQLALWDPSGAVVATRADALTAAVDAIRAGRIVAVKGVGGFHLMCDARSEASVSELRRRKRREEKPFALMFPDPASVRAACDVRPIEEQLLTSPEAPIVLLRRRSTLLAPGIAPGNPYLGALLPYAPLHHLMMRALGFPVVATSGNLTDEPIVTDERDALDRLAGIADVLLIHDRPIARYADDSIARIVGGRPMLLRRARGYAPLPLATVESREPILAVGAHLKNTIGFSVDGQLMLSHHLGDLETPQALEGFHDVVARLPGLYGLEPGIVAHDLHPDYASTQHAETLRGRHVGVQHHAAHVFACMADNELTGEVLGVSWDGTGLGADGTIWGGEFLRVRGGAFRRVAHLRTFPLVGGDAAAREPRRAALGLLYEAEGDAVFERDDFEARLGYGAGELRVLRSALTTGTGVARTSSAGRLFDGVAGLIGLRQRAAFEGQAAMELEFAATDATDVDAYPFGLEGEIVDWAPMVGAIESDRRKGDGVPRIARRFHSTLTEMIVAVAMREELPRVCLTGGCFQNVLLAETTIEALRAKGLTPYWHQRVPPNDGGIALGQLVAASSSHQGMSSRPLAQSGDSL